MISSNHMCKSGMGGGCPHKTAKAAGLLALRIAIGVIFMYMGYQKLGPAHTGASGMFESIGLPGGGNFWAYFVGTLEFVGGIMVILGAYIRYAAIWLSLIMVIAMLTVHRGGPFAGYFLPMSVLGGCLALLGTGAGKFRLVKSECCCKACKEMCSSQGSSCGSGGGACGDKEKMGGGCCGGSGSGACGSHGAECGCKNCCGGECPCGAKGGNCACCMKK